MKRLAVWGFAASLLVASGCSEIGTDYGQSRGVSGRTSLNGFGALRRAFEQAGFRTRDVTRLSNRVRRTDVIVWTPQVLTSIEPNVTTWFDGWLRQGDRTLIYIVPDSGSEADYWLEAARLAPPGQRLEYRRRAARCINERVSWRLNRPAVQSNGWFQIETLQSRRPVRRLRGPWRDTLEADAAAEGALEDSTSERPKPTRLLPAVEYAIVPFDREAAKSAAFGPQAQGTVVGPTGPGSSGAAGIPWMMQTSSEPTSTPVTFRPLLFDDRNSPVVAEIRSQRWKGSKILVVAGGSWLTNYAFSRSTNRRLADQLIASSDPAAPSDRLAGFLTSDWRSIAVSDRAPDAPQTSGMEMLSEWPISMITMHGVVLGVVICLILVPTFGRPRKLRRANASDFSHHLDAVAALMKRVGGENYARQRISDYMKRMHGETSGPWVLPERTAEPNKPAVASAKGKRIPSTQQSSAAGIASAAPPATAGEPSSASNPDHDPSPSSGSQQQDKADR